MTDIWHAFGVSPEFTLLPLCYEMGEMPSLSNDGQGVWITPITSDVDCQKCLEWMHA